MLAVTIFRGIYIISLGNSNVLAGDAIPRKALDTHSRLLLCFQL